MEGHKKVKKSAEPLSPLKAAYKAAQTLARVPEAARKGALLAAAAELGIQF